MSFETDVFINRYDNMKPIMLFNLGLLSQKSALGQPVFVGPQLLGADIEGETGEGHHDSPKLKAPTYAKASVGSRGSWIACAPEGMDRGSTVHSSHLFIHPAILNERTAHGARRLSPNAGSFIERVRP
ncbi:MAG: hypothetical protein ACD_62C00653G0004, partial [uncultured bacterium]